MDAVLRVVRNTPFSVSAPLTILVVLDFGPAALVLVDCDLYSSTVPVLRFISDHLIDGSVLLFDGYNCFDAADDRGHQPTHRGHALLR